MADPTTSAPGTDRDGRTDTVAEAREGTQSGIPSPPAVRSRGTAAVDGVAEKVGDRFGGLEATRHPRLLAARAAPGPAVCFQVLYEIFEGQADTRPDAVAVVFDREETTYAGLERRANGGPGVALCQQQDDMGAVRDLDVEAVAVQVQQCLALIGGERDSTGHGLVSEVPWLVVHHSP